MGYSELGLLLLLGSFTVAQPNNDDNGPTPCVLASRYRAYKKYVYQYTAESRNGVVGTTNLKNGPQVTCLVELDVPQTCRFILSTRYCALSEVSAIDSQGEPVYKLAPGSEAFEAAMERNPLKFTVDGANSVQLFPGEDDPVNILNIKRGIVSALMVPGMGEEPSNLMSTVHGQCYTNYQVNARKDIDTDVTLFRDLSECDQFHSRKLTNSPLALLQKLNGLFSELITSTQDCNYQFDNKAKHMTTAACTEKHIFLPFSHDDNGISSVVTQRINLRSTKRINSRIFDVNPSHSKPLYFEDLDDKVPVQTKDAALSTMQDLMALAGTNQGDKRTSLFHKLVSSLRGLRNDTLSQTVREMLDMSAWLSWQALLQCGTPECTSAIFQAVRRIDGSSLEVDALVYGMSLQANPDADFVRDMLSTAQYKQSKAIMYALANTVKKFHNGDVTPVVTDVSKFMEMLLKDCSGDTDSDYDDDTDTDPHQMPFLVLRVVGVMGNAMQDVSPDLISSILRCVKRTDIPLSNHKAAIQAFRLMDINDKIKNVLMEVYQDVQSPVEKRVAAYLILMKNPDRDLVTAIVSNLKNEKEKQLKSFVVSHLRSIHNSNENQMQLVREYIEMALNGDLSLTNKDFIDKSRTYKMVSPLASVQSNIIFDATNTLPKEVMLETTLKAFDYNFDLFEVGVEGTGFEPTIDALFGDKGFFPNSISRVMYWAGHNTPQMFQKLLDRIIPNRSRMKRQVPQDLLKDITDGVKRLMSIVRSSPAPEATAYLRLLENEIGYIKTSEMRKMADTLFMYYHMFFRVLPQQAIIQMMSSTKNEVFAHYIFMENAFSLPTASGFPLKFSLAGVFTSGAKGGFAFSPGMSQLSFMPTAGLEFITKMGVDIPEYVVSGLEMHTNMYHESSVNAKATISRNQIRLSIPAPTSNTQVFSISNKLLSVSSGQTNVIPSLLDDRTDLTDCQPLITGLNLCTVTRYSDATSKDQAPYFPLTGETRFAVELQPVGGVTEYTATITRGTLQEGTEGRDKVDSLKLTLKAEGVDSSEATASVKYNRNKDVVTAEVFIPDYDLEAGIKLAVTDTNAKGKKMRGITIDVTNKNIPQLTLTGRTRLHMMKDAMVQLQIIVPSLKTDASVTAKLKKDEGVLMDVQTAINLPETSYLQKASLKYDDDRVDVELKLDLNSDIRKLIPKLEAHHRELQQLIDNILDQKVAKTDMKLRHIVTKGIEASNIWLDKLTTGVPYFANLRIKRSISDLTLPALPEKLFLQSDSLFRYQFNKDKWTLSVPVPLGGKTSTEMNIPTSLSIPVIDLPEIGIYIPAKNYHFPTFTIPPSLQIIIPLVGVAEASTKINSNFYSWEVSISGGNTTVDVPSYFAQYKAMAQSPFDLLSYKLEGTGMLSGNAEGIVKYGVESSFSHSLLTTSFSILETHRWQYRKNVPEKMIARETYKIEASSPLGLHASLRSSAEGSAVLHSEDVTGDGTLDGNLKIGSLHANSSYTYKYTLNLRENKGTGESNLRVNLPFIEAHNTIHGVYTDSELKIVSKTNAHNDVLKHVAELKYKDAQLTIKCHAVATPLGRLLSSRVELGASSHMAIVRIESQADDATNRAYSLITGLLDSNGLEVNSEGSLTLDAGRGLHKASVVVGKNGVTTSGTNSLQCSPVTFENIFNGAIDSSGAQLSSKTKAMAEESRGELNIEGKVTYTEATLHGVLKGHTHDATTRHNMDIVLNRRALSLTSNTMGMLKNMKTDNSHALTVTLWTLALRSKSNNLIVEDVYYNQDSKIDIKPFIMSLDVKNDLKFYDASLNNEGHLKLEPLKIDLSGSIKGAYGNNQDFKHTYELSYADLAGTVKSITSGNILNAQFSHNCELEFAGLSSKSNCEARIHSKDLHFDSTIRTMAVPFSLTIDALVNSNGELNLYGNHIGQMYSKLLIKAEPLALAYSHENRLSTTHMLPSGETSTHIDNKFDGLLTPNEQSLSWKTKSMLNDHTYNQDIKSYNNQEKIGVEFSGTILTDFFNKLSTDIRKRSEPGKQEFSMAGFLKYDKASDCHMIEIPFIKGLPAAFEHIKNTLVQALESLQHFVNELDISQAITEFRAKLNQLPRQVKRYMRELDLDRKMNKIKEKITYLTNEFVIEMEDLELIMEKLRNNLESTVLHVATKIKDVIIKIKEYVETGRFADMISNILSQIGNNLQNLDKKYQIKNSLVKTMDAVEDIIRQVNLEKLTEKSAAWLRDLDHKYGILQKIKEKSSELKLAIQNFDIKKAFQDVKDYILSVDMAKFIEQLSYKIPSAEITRVIESIHDVIVNWIDEYEIPNKLNAVYSYFKDLFLRHNLDEKFKQLLDQIVVLIKEFKIELTVQSVVDTLKSINFENAFDKIMQFIQRVTAHLRVFDLKKSIDEIKESISSLLKSLKEFDYSAFVEKTNRKIAELTNYINDHIKRYEIVQKVNAVRDFFREIQNSVYTYLNKLKNTKVADAVKKLSKVIDSTIYKDVKLKMQEMLEDLKQRVLDMDLRGEIYIYLQKASQSYTNIVAYISVQFNRLMEAIGKVLQDNEIIHQVKKAVERLLDALKRAEINISSFTMPLTDLVIPAFRINLNKLYEIYIPAQISVPEFTILDLYTVPAFVIDFEMIKTKIVAFIDTIRGYEIQWPEPEEIFGDVKVLYLCELPDLTFPEITLSEIKIPTISIPKLNLTDFEITMLPIPEIKIPELASDICIPVFGKLQGEFKLHSPHYNVLTTGKIENSTTSPKTPQFTATLTSQAKSSISLLEYTFDANTRLEAPRMKKLLFTETVKAAHEAFSIDHEGSLTLTGSAAEASAKTISKATTHKYTANLVNNMALTLKSGISATLDTTYNHSLNIPSCEISSQATLTQKAAVTTEPGEIIVTSETIGNGKWSIQDYSDEGAHKSNLEFNISFNTARLNFAGETDCKALKVKRRLTAESVMASHVTVEGRCDVDIPSVKKSVTVFNGEAHIGDLKLALTASHDVELTGSLPGSMSNSFEFMAHPFEIVLDAKNKLHSKIAFPLKLTGKVDLQNDYCIILNSDKQHVCWFTLARFNQYKYNHNFTAENNERNMFSHLLANGEANLDFLLVPLSIPEMTIPYVEVKTPKVKELSLWEDVGFKALLTTPQQSFDMNMKLHYYKNPDVHSFEMYLEPIYYVISNKAKTLQAKFERCRDKVVALLKDSYNQAKSQYIKHKVDTSNQPPRFLTVPGYKVPILKIDVSAFKAELPAFSYFVPKEVSTPNVKIPVLGFSVPSYTLVLPSLELAVIHVPEGLSQMKLPTFSLPSGQNRISIPALGNVTYDFSFKSAVITLSANAGLYNESDIVARFGAFSASVFDILKVKVDGTTSLTKKRGIKLASTLSLEHKNVEGIHEFAVSLNKRSVEASLVNNAKIELPFLKVEFAQELLGNTKTKPNVATTVKANYMFNIPQIESVGKGNIYLNLALEALSSYVSVDTSIKGNSDILLMDSCNFVGELNNEANFYINTNVLRSTVKTGLNTNIDKRQKQKRSISNILHFDANKLFTLEVSLRRIIAKVDYTSNNNVEFASFTTNGKHVADGLLEFVPLTTLKSTLNIDASQPSSLGHVGLLQIINLAITSEKQSFSWSGKEQLASLIHACDLLMFNDEDEVRMDLTGSVEGYLAFLKSIKLPVYQKTLWDVLKFDQVTNVDDLQFFNISTSVVYAKTMDGLELAIPAKVFENGVTFSIPETSIAVPAWIKEIQHFIRNIDMRYENTEVSDHLTIPPIISLPAFVVPFTNLHIKPFLIDLKNLSIPKVITTPAFDIMLPGLPKMSVPSYDIHTEYLQGKISFLSLKIPQYDITISSFTLPKVLSLNGITNRISNLELPTIIIPEQKIEIPEIALHLPSSVSIPAFGELTATLKVSSPIYTVTTTANLEKNNSSLLTSLTSVCTSTMIFLEHELTARATLGFDNGLINLHGKCSLIHNDINVDWQHVFAQHMRIKRQSSLDGGMEFRHTVNVDITSPSFVDMSFRFASRKDGITASMSSPSCGFLGLNIHRKSPSQIYGKLFSRNLSTPDRDSDILTVKATLRNSQRLILQTSWNLDVLQDVVEGSKDRIPAITDAVFKFINKYHTAHFGFDLNRGGTKLKNSVFNVIEGAYQEVTTSLNMLQNSLEQLSDQGKHMYKKASDTILSIDMHDVTDEWSIKVKQLLNRSEQNIYILLDAVTKFLSQVTFSLPGSDEKISGLDAFRQARRSASRATDRAIQRFDSLMETIGNKIRQVDFKIPGTSVVVNGNELMDNLKASLRYINKQIKHSLQMWFKALRKGVSDLFQVISEKGAKLIAYLQDENLEIASEIDAVSAQALQSSKQYLGEAKRSMVEYKALSKHKVQKAYNEISMERINDDIKEFINILQPHLKNLTNGGIRLMTTASENMPPYIRVRNKNMDIDIPLPFFWKSFSDWPTQSRQ